MRSRFLSDLIDQINKEGLQFEIACSHELTYTFNNFEKEILSNGEIRNLSGYLDPYQGFERYKPLRSTIK